MIRNRRATCLFATLAVSVCLAAGAQAAAAAGMYKWTDEKGAVHYSDQMPPDAVNKGAVMFDKKGRQVKKIEPAPTPDQIEAKKLEDDKQKEITRQRDERTRKDLALLQSYTSENEIELARSRAISAVSNQIKSAEIYTGDLTRRQQDLEKQKAALGGKPMPAALETELTSLNDEIARQGRLLVQKKDELATVNARYDVDKRRWQEIKSDQSRAAAVGLEPPPKAPAKPASNPPTAAAAK